MLVQTLTFMQTVEYIDTSSCKKFGLGNKKESVNPLNHFTL